MKMLSNFNKVGEEVYAAWWDSGISEQNGTNAAWFPGRVTSYKEIDIDSPYGPTRLYDILFDDGDTHKDLEDYWVFSKEDYLLSVRNDGVPSWIGVRNDTDGKAAKEDKWPRIVGWYVATIDGKDQAYPRLSGKRLGKVVAEAVVHNADCGETMSFSSI